MPPNQPDRQSRRPLLPPHQQITYTISPTTSTYIVLINTPFTPLPDAFPSCKETHYGTEEIRGIDHHKIKVNINRPDPDLSSSDKKVPEKIERDILVEGRFENKAAVARYLKNGDMCSLQLIYREKNGVEAAASSTRASVEARSSMASSSSTGTRPRSSTLRRVAGQDNLRGPQ